MDHQYAIKCIAEGMELYLKILGQAENMQFHAGDVEWIAPLPGKKAGPALVFKVALDEKSTSARIDEMSPDLEAGLIPALWFIPPTSTPANIMDLLAAKNFKPLYNPTAEPEYGMALWMRDNHEWPGDVPGVEVKIVKSKEEYKTWVDVVNTALHGWEMLDTENYHHLLTSEQVKLYLALLGGEPAGTVATFQKGDNASVEFVSTLEKYHHRGVAAITCATALRDLQKSGAHIATLRADFHVAGLYRKLGFQPYFDLKAMAYEKKEQ